MNFPLSSDNVYSTHSSRATSTGHHQSNNLNRPALIEQSQFHIQQVLHHNGACSILLGPWPDHHKGERWSLQEDYPRNCRGDGEDERTGWATQTQILHHLFHRTRAKMACRASVLGVLVYAASYPATVVANWIQFLKPKPGFRARDLETLLGSFLLATAMFLNASNAWKRDRLWRSIAPMSEWSLVNAPSIPIIRLDLTWKMVLIQHVLLAMLRECRSWRLVGCLFEAEDCSLFSGLFAMGNGRQKFWTGSPSDNGLGFRSFFALLYGDTLVAQNGFLATWSVLGQVQRNSLRD